MITFSMFNIQRLEDSVCRNLTVDLANHTLQSLARTALREVVGTVGNHVLDNLRPAHTACQLGYQVGLDLSRVSVG